MAFCKNCGQPMADDAAFCANCGTPAAPQQAAQQAAQQNYQQAAQPQQAYQAPVQGQPIVTGDADVQQNRGIAWLSYVGLLFLIPLFVRKTSDYCKFHVKQGATICALEIAYSIVKAIIMAILGAIFSESYYGFRFYTAPYYVFDVIFNLAYIFIAVISIMGIVAAATGQKKELPLVGKIPFIGDLIEKIYAAINK